MKTTNEYQPITLPEIKEIWADAISTYKTYNALYVDIPFCKQHCNYCLYKKFKYNNESDSDNYLKLIDSEMKEFSPLFEKHKITSIHIGGGSPSVLSIQQLYSLNHMLCKHFCIDTEEKASRTIELNPCDTTKDKLDFILKESIFNRLSFGIQSFSENVLSFYNRRYFSPLEYKSLMEYIYSIKDIDVNIDMMIGLEGETQQTIIETYNIIKSMNPNRITLYINENREQDEDFIELVANTIGKLDISNYLVNSFSSLGKLPSCYIFYNKNTCNKYYYKYLYLMNPYVSNIIGFGTRSRSYIKKLDLTYVRTDEIDYKNSKYFYYIYNKISK